MEEVAAGLLVLRPPLAQSDLSVSRPLNTRLLTLLLQSLQLLKKES